MGDIVKDKGTVFFSVCCLIMKRELNDEVKGKQKIGISANL